jgi:soluble lytic murein transglycosylase
MLSGAKKLNLKTWCLYLGCCLLTLPLQTSAANSDDTSRLRSNFLDAENAFKQGDMGRYRVLKAKLKEYPLLPYLEYMELRQQLKTETNPDINGYLKRYPEVPLGSLLRNAWLDQLAKKGRWNEYLEFHQPGGSTRRHCNYLQALLQTGHAEQALQQVKDLWLYRDTRPDSCDPVQPHQIGQLSTPFPPNRTTGLA